MFEEYKAYAKMFIINEEGEKVPDAAPSPDEKKLTPEQKQAPKVNSLPVKKEETKTDVDMKFSVDLATEFSNTVNEFTSVCAKIVEGRLISKDLSDKFYDLYSKIKNLADAASKTE